MVLEARVSVVDQSRQIPHGSERSQRLDTPRIAARNIPEGPNLIGNQELYGLEEGEMVIYSVCHRTKGDDFFRVYTEDEIDSDPEVASLLIQLEEEARVIEQSPQFNPLETGYAPTSREEHLGLFRDIRVVTLRNSVHGHREKGWTLIGKEVNENTQD